MKDPRLPDGLYAWSQPAHYGLTIRGFATRDTGKPLLHFLHGNGLCGLTYWPMLAHLRSGFDLLITDIQGHGDSDAGERFLGWNANAEIASKVLSHHLSQRQSRRPVYGVAHSLGGALTTLMAAARPGLFDRLVLLDPVYFPPSMIYAMAGLQLSGLLDKLAPLSRQARRRRTHWPSRLAAEHALKERGMFRGWHPDSLRAFVRYAIADCANGEVTLKCPSWIEARIFASFPKGLWKAIAELQTPAHLMMAEDTYDFAARGAERAVRMNPVYSQQKVRGEHCFMQQYPEQTAAGISAILSEADSVRGG